MHKNQSLRQAALEIFQAAIQAADPKLCLRKALQKQGFAHPSSPKGRTILIAAGKAAVPMMEEALCHISPSSKYDALIVTNYENAKEVKGAKLLLAGHPVPDQNGADAAQCVIDLLENARENDQIIALISGGASALLPAPIPAIDFEEKAKVNSVLLKAGFEITELNLVRQQLSQLKGGGFTRLAAPAPVSAYILSDVIGDDLRVVASGLTAEPIGDPKTALALLSAPQIKSKIPSSVLNALSTKSQTTSTPKAHNTLIGSNQQSLQAAFEKARELDWMAEIKNSALTGTAINAASAIAHDIQSTSAGKNICLLYGGETVVEVKGDGKGGRNQELALRVAVGCQNNPGEFLFLSGGTDGRDGPTDAAGGIVDPKTIMRMEEKNIDPNRALEMSDSYHALLASDDLIITGGTGTNVADIQIALIP